MQMATCASAQPDYVNFDVFNAIGPIGNILETSTDGSRIPNARERREGMYSRQNTIFLFCSPRAPVS
jgi:hypothetical protein